MFVLPSVRHVEQLGFHGMDFHEILIFEYFSKVCQKTEVSLNLTILIGTLCEDLCTFMITSRCILLILTDVSDKIVKEIKTHILRSVTFFSENRVVCGIMKKTPGKAAQATDDNITWRMHIACWKSKATKSLSEYVLLIAFPQQQWLSGGASLLRYTYIEYIVHFQFDYFSLYFFDNLKCTRYYSKLFQDVNSRKFYYVP